MWEIEYLLSAGALRQDVAQWVEELLTTADPDRAADLMVVIESAVAPVNGGLSDDAPAVVSGLVAGLPRVGVETRPEVLLLLTQILGSVDVLDSPAAVDAGRVVEGALPMLAAVVESGSDADIAQGIDLISMCSLLSGGAAERAAFYLTRIAGGASGAVKESAERELAEVRKLLG